MKKIVILLLGVALSVFILESSKNEMKNKVNAITQNATLYDKGKTLTYKESYEEFDQKGKSTLKIDYKKDGSVDSKKTFKYNNAGDKIEEIEYTGSGSVDKKTTTTYNAQGEKDTETTFDGSGRMIKKASYSYNAKNLKTEKKTYSAANTLESVKKWEYIFY